MRKEKGRLIFSPSDLINFMENEFVTWMDRYYLEFPAEISPDDDREEARIFQRLGHEHEERLLQRFRGERVELAEIISGEGAFERTIEAISRGSQVIYHAALQHDQFAGYSDFLMRIDRPSRLGNYSYEIWDTKLARRAKPYFVIQLCCYAEMLEALQGYRPEFITSSAQARRRNSPNRTRINTLRMKPRARIPQSRKERYRELTITFVRISNDLW